MKSKSLLLLALVCTMFCADVFAQSDTLREVISTANRIPTTFNNSDRTVDIIDSAFIRQSPATTVQEVLEYFAGVDVRNRGPRGVQSDISIRGSNFEQALIMVNGVKVSDPQTGHHVLNLPISLDDIERIEVLKGSGARAYGQNAFSGAINIITKNPEQTQLRLRGLYGEHNLREINAAFTHVQEKVTQTISGTYAGSDGYRHNTDFESRNLFYTSQIKAGSSKMLLNAGYNDRKFGANGFYSERFPDQRESTRTLFVSTGLQTSGKNTFAPRIYFRQHDDEFLLKINDTTTIRNIHTSYVGGGEFNYAIPSKFGTTALGGEIRNEVLSSSSLLERSRQNGGITLEHKFTPAKRFTFTPGFFLNWTNTAKWEMYPGADIGFKATDNLHFYASANQSFRIPSFTELYYKDPANAGNPALVPEKAWTYEGGARFHYKGHSLRVASFYRNGNNLIDWLKDSLTWEAQNVGHISTKGGEAQWSWILSEMYPALFITRLNLQYAYLQSETVVRPEQSKYLLDHLRHQVIAGLDHKVYHSLVHSIKLRYEDRVIYAPYWLLDSRLCWQGKQYMAYAQVHNILGTKYTEIGRIPMPGRWFSVGAELTLPVGKRKSL